MIVHHLHKFINTELISKNGVRDCVCVCGCLPVCVIVRCVNESVKDPRVEHLEKEKDR